MSEFSGKTKYPVSIWNRGAEGTKNKAFFLRSGEQVLHAIAGEREFLRDNNQQPGLSEGGPVFRFGNNASSISSSYVFRVIFIL